ncbi:MULTISPECIES: NADP-dependent oxidoreductase [Pseudomonas]|uniref:NADP-dependent oxidoreductase n=1 Tax=Pseudomonas TaxID=286 RepID=UPI0015733316|nr:MULTISPECIES: NADP-dependent oxidoreductase [Pseudomonas]MBG6123573.1 NADPH:quinone reductase-like Zn-dependent oxidoreductase [Pseudomonas sp. M2]NSX20345.1 NADP-dependent oxidoreductase [Pseudomonas putida]HDS1744495.1 NADP-dependent oxidoreductase [Pseudomonas putida]
MKAFLIDRYGKDVVGDITEVPEPQVDDFDVLVEVHAASVNVLDIKIRKGEFKLILPFKMPLILGNDVAGTVKRVGGKVSRFRVGDEVYARVDQARMGGFAEFVAVSESAVSLKPANLNMEEAASLPLVALTAWQALAEMAKVQPGQKVLIQAGSGGVGSIAIQVAKHLGAFVATTTSTGNVSWVKALGADVVIDYKTQRFESQLSDYDVVLSGLGGDVLEKSLHVLKPGGQLISISGPPTPEFAEQLRLSWLFRQVVRLISRGIRKKSEHKGVNYKFLFMRASGAQLAELARLVETGVIKPVVDRAFALGSTADALAYVAEGRAKGKVVVKVK